MKINGTFLKLIVGSTILGFLIYKIGVKSILGVFSGINLIVIPIFLIILLLVNFFGTWKLMLFLKIAKIEVSFLKLYHFYFLSWCLSLFTPGRVGELLLVYFLKNEETELGKGSAVVIMDKIIGVIVTFLLAITGIFVFFNLLQSLKIIVPSLIMLIASLYMVFSDFGRGMIKRFILRKWESKFAGFSKTLFLITKSKKVLLYNLILSFVKWVVNAFILYTLFIGFKQKVPILMVLLTTTTIAIISLIPISINGLGIKESIGVFLFTLIGVPTPVSTSVFLTLLVINYLIALVYLLLFFKRKDYKINLRNLAKSYNT